MLHPIYFSTFEKCQEHFTIPNYFHIYLRPLKMTYFFFSGVLLCENIIQTYSFVQLLKICWIKNVPWLWFSYNALYSRAFSTVYITPLGPINPYYLGYKHDQKPLLLALYCITFVLFSSSSLVSCLWQNDVMLYQNQQIWSIKYHIWQASVATPHTWVLCLQTQARS